MHGRPVAAAPVHASPFGIAVSEVADGTEREIGVRDRGVVVVQVEPASPAAQAGLERGDVLLRVGDVTIERLEDYARGVRSIARGGMIRLLARRDGRAFWVAFERR
jgi:S1-C subfamily serine protease